MIVLNAENKIMGRIAAYAAKQAMLGNKVEIVNCEKAIITGHKKRVLADYKRKMHMGVPKKGPFLLRQPDRFFRRRVRGMLPYKTPRGREAFGNVMCHIGVPKQFEKEKSPDIPKTDVSKVPNLRYVTVGEICKELGGKFKVEAAVKASKVEAVVETPKEEPKEKKPAEEKAEESKEKQEEEAPAEVKEEAKKE